MASLKTASLLICLTIPAAWASPASVSLDCFSESPSRSGNDVSASCRTDGYLISGGYANPWQVYAEASAASSPGYVTAYAYSAQQDLFGAEFGPATWCLGLTCAPKNEVAASASAFSRFQLIAEEGKDYTARVSYSLERDYLDYTGGSNGWVRNASTGAEANTSAPDPYGNFRSTYLQMRSGDVIEMYAAAGAGTPIQLTGTPDAYGRARFSVGPLYVGFFEPDYNSWPDDAQYVTNYRYVDLLAVPEPSTGGLSLAGLTALALVLRRCRHKFPLSRGR